MWLKYYDNCRDYLIKIVERQGEKLKPLATSVTKGEKALMGKILIIPSSQQTEICLVEVFLIEHTDQGRDKCENFNYR